MHIPIKKLQNGFTMPVYGLGMEEKDIELLRNDFPNQKSVSDSVPLE